WCDVSAVRDDLLVGCQHAVAAHFDLQELRGCRNGGRLRLRRGACRDQQQRDGQRCIPEFPKHGVLYLAAWVGAAAPSTALSRIGLNRNLNVPCGCPRNCTPKPVSTTCPFPTLTSSAAGLPAMRLPPLIQPDISRPVSAYRASTRTPSGTRTAAPDSWPVSPPPPARPLRGPSSKARPLTKNAACSAGMPAINGCVVSIFI